MKSVLTAIAIICAASIAAIHLGGLGPLNPPPGPVTETQPSLAGIEAKIDSLTTDFNANSIASGPWKILKSHQSGALLNDLNGELLISERVYVKSIVAYECSVALFDGPGGSLNTNGRVESELDRMELRASDR